MVDGWTPPESVMGIALMAKAFPHKVDYRLHRIEVHMDRHGAVATVFDGDKPVYTARDSDQTEALERAKAWIDEQDEPEIDYDLHAG